MTASISVSFECQIRISVPIRSRGQFDVSLISKWLKSEHTSSYLSCKDHLLLGQIFLETYETKARSFLG